MPAALPAISVITLHPCHLRTDQDTGRWTQEEPIGIAGGINLYQFNGNDPVTFRDPYGLCPEEMQKNEPECHAWNVAEARQAEQILRNEIAAGNPHALPQTMEVLAYNADRAKSICTELGGKTDYACANGSTIVLNADAGAASMSAFIVHEEQHILGAEQNGPRSRPAGEMCANKRQTLYVSQMVDKGAQASALANKHIQETSNPNYPGCGF